MPLSVAQRTQWRGQRDTTWSRFMALLGLSVLLHAPLTPLAALVGLLALVAPPEPDQPDLGQIEAIPVSLLSDDELARLGGEQQAAPKEPDEPAPAEALPDEDEDLSELFSGEDVEPDPSEPDEQQQPTADAGAGGVEKEQGGGADAGAEEGAIGDPMALAGAASSVTDPNANVKLLIFNDRIRRHPISKRIGPMLARVPQWRSFFGPTPLDPIRDLDRIYVAGPQFRVSADLVAVAEYNVSQRKMRQAIDAIVQRKPKGRWLDSEIPAALAKADRAERTFVLPKQGILVMVPPRLADDALDKGPKLDFPRVEGDAALVAFVATPWRVLIGMNVPLQIPKSIKSAMIKVSPTDDGGLTIQIQAVDESADTAARNAELLSQAINIVTQRQMRGLGALLFGERLEIIEPVKLRAKGNTIEGTARASARQLDRILNFGEAWLDAIDPRPPRKAPSPAGSVKKSGSAPRPERSPRSP